jgi:hypothetical protein
LSQLPGFVNTNWGTEMPLLIKGFVRLIQPLGKSPADCAEFMCEGYADAESDGVFDNEIFYLFI